MAPCAYQTAARGGGLVRVTHNQCRLDMSITQELCVLACGAVVADHAGKRHVKARAGEEARERLGDVGCRAASNAVCMVCMVHDVPWHVPREGAKGTGLTKQGSHLGWGDCDAPTSRGTDGLKEVVWYIGKNV